MLFIEEEMKERVRIIHVSTEKCDTTKTKSQRVKEQVKTILKESEKVWYL